VRWYVKRSTSFSFLSSSQWSGDFGNAGGSFY